MVVFGLCSREFLGKYFLEIHQFLLKNCSYWNRIAHPIASSKLRGQGMMNYKWDYKRLKLGSLAVSLFEMIMRWICAAKTSTPVHTQEDTKTNSNKVPCMQKNTRLHNILAEWFHICLLTAFGSFLPQQLSMTQRVFVGSNQLQRGDYLFSSKYPVTHRTSSISIGPNTTRSSFDWSWLQFAR